MDMINKILVTFLKQHGGIKGEVSSPGDGGEQEDKEYVLQHLSALIEQLQSVSKELKKAESADLDGKEEKNVIADKSLIQITASKSEMDRRIAAFIDRKRQEVNERNRREFCHRLTDNEDTSGCARTDAVYTPRSGCRSHVKVSRVVNRYGPQTSREPPKPVIKSEPSEQTQTPAGIEERLKTMETHVNIRSGGRLDTYGRIKQLEERLLYLESISPEYMDFLTMGPPNKRLKRDPESSEKMEELNDNMSIDDIDSQIQALKRSLLHRQLSS